MSILITFDEEELSRKYTEKAQTGVTYDTAVVGNPRAVQQRNVNRYDFVRTWDIEYGGMSPAEKLELEEFYITRFGRAFGFRFYPPSDRNFLGDVIGVGDGVITRFYLRRNYAARNRFVSRRILKPIFPLLTITVDDEKVAIITPEGNITPEGDFPVLNNPIDVDWNAGFFDFTTAPASGEIVRAAAGEYHLPACFDVDDLSAADYGMFADSASVRLVEILPAALDAPDNGIVDADLAFAEPLAGTYVQPEFDVSFTSSNVTKVWLYIKGTFGGVQSTSLWGTSTSGPSFAFADVERPETDDGSFRLEAVGTNASGQIVVAGIDLFSLVGTVYSVVHEGDPVTTSGDPVTVTVY